MIKKLLVIAGIMAFLASNAYAGDLKLRHYFNDSLSIGIDKGSAISYWDIKKTELLGGYTIPLVLFEFPDDNEIFKDYDISLDGGIAGDLNNADGILGIGSNAPKVVAQYLIDKSINKVMDKSFTIPDRVKVGFMARIDTSRLFEEGEIAGSYGLEFGIKF